MAQYRLEAKVISRSKGQSAIASAAYRSGSAMTAPDGQPIDYTRKRGVAASFILAPADAPAWVHDRQSLWSAVEAGEKRKDAQLSREFTLNLPIELDLAAQEALVREWVKSELVAAGMAADVNLHLPRLDHPHAHIMTTLRELGPDGFNPKKNRDWNSDNQLDKWRVSWELFQNQALAKAGVDARVDHRTYEAQGLDRIGANLSRGAYELEKRGITTREGEEVRAKVAAFNQGREQLQAIELELAALAAVEEGPHGPERSDRAQPEPEGPSIADRRAVRQQRAARAAARREAELHGPSPEAVREPHPVALEPVVGDLEQAVAVGGGLPAPGPGAGPGVGGELGVRDGGRPGAGAGLPGADRPGPGQADDRPGAVGRDAGRAEAGRPGGTPEPGVREGLRPGGEPGRGPVPDPGPQRAARVVLESLAQQGERPEWMGRKFLPPGKVATPEEVPSFVEDLRSATRTGMEKLRDKLTKPDMLREEAYIRQAFGLGPAPRPSLPWGERQADLVRDAQALGQARAEALAKAQAIAQAQTQAEAGIKAKRDAQAEARRKATPGAIPEWLRSEKTQERDAFGDEWALTHEPIGPGLKTPAQLQELAAQAGLDCSLDDKQSRPWDLPRLVEEVDRKYGDPNKERAEWTVRKQNNLRERGQAYYQRPWILRQPDLVLDGWRKVREKLGHALQEAQEVVSRSAPLRFLKDHLESFRLPLQERRQAAQEVARAARELRAAQRPQEPSKAPQKPSKGDDKGMRR